jgi:hypothetical protein
MNKLVFYFFLLSSFIQCKEPYEFSTNPQDGLLIIDGGISDLAGPYYMSLSTTSNAKRRPEPLAGATIYINDDYNNLEYFTESAPGKYLLAGNTIKAITGRKYTLNIKLQDGRTYTSTKEVLPELDPSSDSLYTIIQQEKRLNGSEKVEVTSWRVNSLVDFRLPKENKKGYYRWDLTEVFSVFPTCFPGAISCPPICYVTQSGNYNLILIDPKNYSGEKISKLLLQDREIDFSFDTRHYFVITQNVITEEAYNYWLRVQDLITKKGSIFDTPPYTIKGNISNTSDPNEPVFGYFEVSKQKITRTFIDRGLIPIPVQTCQFYSPDFQYGSLESYCFNCLQLDGSSTTEPDWFW